MVDAYPDGYADGYAGRLYDNPYHELSTGWLTYDEGYDDGYRDYLKHTTAQL